MHINQLKNSNFLKKEDCDPPVLVTIATVTEENVAKEGAPQEMKWAIHFDEFEKPMVLNSTNGQLIAKITGSEESDEWSGQQVVLYHDPNVSFGGKLIGGIRIRAPKAKKQAGTASKRPQAAPEPAPEEPGDDEIPF